MVDPLDLPGARLAGMECAVHEVVGDRREHRPVVDGIAALTTEVGLHDPIEDRHAGSPGQGGELGEDLLRRSGQMVVRAVRRQIVRDERRDAILDAERDVAVTPLGRQRRAHVSVEMGDVETRGERPVELCTPLGLDGVGMGAFADLRDTGPEVAVLVGETGGSRRASDRTPSVAVVFGCQGEVDTDVEVFGTRCALGEVVEPGARHHDRTRCDRAERRQLDECLVGAVTESDVVGVDDDAYHPRDGSPGPSTAGGGTYSRRVELTHLSGNTDPGEVADHLRTWGYAIVDDVADQATMDRLGDEAAPYIDASDGGRDDYDGRFTRRTGALIARCPTARELVMHPTVVGTVERFLDQATTVQLHLTQIISIDPGETQQKLHRDQMAFDFFPFPADYHAQCNTMWALTDFTAENGGTHVVPGSSSVPDAAAASLPGGQVEMRRGSVLFYDGKVLHGGGANRSDGPRQGVNITYAVGWVRQEENQYLACPPEIARTLDDDLLRMIGYREGAFALGYVGDQQDPLAALRGEHVKKQTIGEVTQKSADHRQFLQELKER